MKKIFLVISAFVILFSACDTGFDVNADWEEISVVYGLLDPATDTQYIRISKAYLGEGDALIMAEDSDSINFDPSDLVVNIHKLGVNNILESVICDTTSIDKEDGIFASDNNIIYRSVVPANFLTDNNRYAITIRNIDSGNEVSAETEVISYFEFETSLNYPFGFYNPNAGEGGIEFPTKNIQWYKSKNGEIYQLDLIFKYLENGDLKSLVWSQPQEVFEGGIMDTRIEGVKFFNFLTQNLIADTNFTRQFVDLDLVMTVGTENLNTYIRVNQPINGISQQRPSFTNIYNGIGIFSSRYTYTVSSVGLSPNTIDYLIDKLGRNFQ